MRRILALVVPVLLLLASPYYANADQTPNSVSDLTNDQLVQLQNELKAWKASPAGQQAVKNGLAAKPAPAIAPQAASTDELQRFLNSKKIVEKLQQEQPKAIFSLRTPFALMSPQEFAQYVNKSNVAQHRELMQSQQGLLPTIDTRHLRQGVQTASPTEVDWQAAGCVSHIKDQSSCGVCWIFASIGALEGGYCAKSPTKTLPVLSEQDVVSCGPTKSKCWSGWSYVSYDWIIRMNGGSVCTEATYPYSSWGDSGPACTKYDDANFKCDKPDIGLSSYFGAQYANHQDLENVVATRPVASQVKAGLAYFQYYSGGVLMGDESKCPGTYPDHEVTIVGYTTRNGTQVWKIKNQWGSWWGENGYAYLERGYQGATYGTCGIETWAYYPIFKDQAPWIDNLRCGNMRNGVEILGTTMKTVYVYDVYSGQCCDACRREQGCKAAVISGNACILKSTLDGERYDPSFAVSSIMVMPRADANKLMCMPIEENVDYPGNDLSRTLTKDAAECCDTCTRDPNCGAYTWTKWMGGSCFLKYSKASYSKKSPLPDGSAYFRSGELYRCQPLRQNTDFVGEDFMNKPAKTAAECCALCRANYPCQAFSWSNYQGGTCWLKKKAAAWITNPGVISATVY